MYLEDFCEKDVISIRDCRKLGRVEDLEFNECNGCIGQIVVRGRCGLWGLFRSGEETVISYGRIKQIGPDIILVDV